jgi:hypothetical protein
MINDQELIQSVGDNHVDDIKLIKDVRAIGNSGNDYNKVVFSYLIFSRLCFEYLHSEIQQQIRNCPNPNRMIF